MTDCNLARKCRKSARAAVLHHGNACANRTPEFGRGHAPDKLKNP
jgi:hypothetical protein